MYLDEVLSERSAWPRDFSSRAGEALRQAIERLRAQLGRAAANPESVDEPIIAALQARLESIDKEIQRLTCLASGQHDIAKQEACLALARDLQRDARAIREQIRLHRGLSS